MRQVALPEQRLVGSVGTSRQVDLPVIARSRRRRHFVRPDLPDPKAVNRKF